MIGWFEDKISINGILIHYYRSGGEKPQLLLLHGFTDDGLCWSRVAGELQDQYDIIIVDARGHGKSEGLTGGFTFQKMVEDAAGVIRTLRLERPCVFGHSMGAITTAVLAAKEPGLVGAAILEDPPFLAAIETLSPAEAEKAHQISSQIHQNLLAMRDRPRSESIALISLQNPAWHESEVAHWVDAKVALDLDVYQQKLNVREFPWQEVLKQIVCPTLLLTGDPIFGGIVTPDQAQEAAHLLVAGEVVHISGAGHCIHRDRYVESMQIITGFLKQKLKTQRLQI